MEQGALNFVNNCLNANIYTYLETSGGQSSNLYINVVHFFNICHLKTVVFLHQCLILQKHLAIVKSDPGPSKECK
jgi:hypothetical protein